RERVRAGVDPSELKARLLWNFTQFLGRLSARQPLCIVLENLQWADASSLELLHFVARNISGHPILILASYNETERDNNPTLKSTEQSLVGLGVATQMHLAPLSEVAVEQMVTGRFDSDTTPVRDFAKRLYDWTLGNPFFVEETLKWLIQAGSLKRHGGQWTGWDLEALDLPPTVRDAVVSRIERLKPEAREAAVVAAVVGTRLTFDKLLSISGLNETDLANSLDELVAAKVFDEVRGTQGTSYDFAHPILQQVLYDSLGAGQAALLHSRIAEALESHYGKAASSHAGELAFHFSRSGALKTKAVKYLSQAGKTALDTYANREAAGFLAAALEQMDRQDASEADRDQVVRNLARARQRLGEYDEALSLWATAQSAARRENDHESLATIEYRMGLACFWSGRFEEALDHYDRGLHSAAQGSNSAALVRVYLAKAICLQEMGRIELAKADAESALRAAEDSGSDSLLARAHRALLLLYAWTGPADLALAHGEKAIAFSESAGEGMLEWTAHWGLALLSGLTGSGTDMAAHLAQCGRLEDQLRSPLLPLWTAELALQHASWTGEWDDGIATGERSIALARSLRQRTLLPRLLVWTGLLYLWRHDLTRARQYFDEGWRLSDAGAATEQRVDVQTVVPAHMGLAAYHLETGNFAEAIRIGEAGIELADRIGYIAWSVQWLLPVVGEAALWNHDFERAEKHCARMRRDGQRLSNPVALAMADACDGMLLLQRDRNPLAAIPVLRSAVTMLDQIPLPDVA
ncbi:MAG TPA: tetratricopeptide repeat protein, partial [Gemmatimonadaceae bacterium]|nr:tetratricopeptide repeat protein [Gemmatimonadaceae bacterium]